MINLEHFQKMIADARPTCEDDYGSERQVAAEMLLFIDIRDHLAIDLAEDWESWTVDMTIDESFDWISEKIEAYYRGETVWDVDREMLNQEFVKGSSRDYCVDVWIVYEHASDSKLTRLVIVNDHEEDDPYYSMCLHIDDQNEVDSEWKEIRPHTTDVKGLIQGAKAIKDLIVEIKK